MSNFLSLDLFIVFIYLQGIYSAISEIERFEVLELQNRVTKSSYVK